MQDGPPRRTGQTVAIAGLGVLAIALLIDGLATRSGDPFAARHKPETRVAPRTVAINPAARGGAPQQCTGRPAKAEPKGTPGRWITTDDYPTSALRREQEGRVAISFTVAPSGRVSECHVTASSGVPVLDRASCDLLVRRARYRPARDAQGCPVPATLTHRIRWQIPRD